MYEFVLGWRLFWLAMLQPCDGRDVNLEPGHACMIAHAGRHQLWGSGGTSAMSPGVAGEYGVKTKYRGTMPCVHSIIVVESSRRQWLASQVQTLASTQSKSKSLKHWSWWQFSSCHVCSGLHCPNCMLGRWMVTPMMMMAYRKARMWRETRSPTMLRTRRRSRRSRLQQQS